MTRERAVSRGVVVILAALSIAAAGSSCEGRRVGEPIEGTDATIPSTPGPPSDGPVTDVDVHTYRLTSAAQLLELLQGVGWAEAVVLPGSVPFRLELWSGDGHWHAQTTWRSSGRRVQVTQAGFEGLPPGRIVEVRGEDGVRSDGGLYWLERGFTIALSPGATSIARELEWVALR
ncbi:MAG: hypothetical protein ACRDG8_05850 [Actinomycetota bacterium]